MNKEIMLGVFTSHFFTERSRHEWLDWPFINLLGNVPYKGVIDLVGQACTTANVINFLLDWVSLPLSQSSHTCRELELILNTPEYLAKTKFWIDGKHISTDEVLEAIHQAKLSGYERDFEELILVNT